MPAPQLSWLRARYPGGGEEGPKQPAQSTGAEQLDQNGATSTIRTPSAIHAIVPNTDDVFAKHM